MKGPFLLLASALATLPAVALATTSAIPASFPAERYETLIAKSPFALATAPVAPPPPPTAGFADGWFVSGLARLEGQDFVTIKARDMSAQFTLFGGEPSNGVTLKKVDWSTSIGRSTVTIEKDGQTAKLEFNQAELTTPTGPAAAPQPSGARSMPVTGAPNAPRPVIPRPVQPVVPQQQTYGNGIKPGMPQPAKPGMPQPMKPGGVPQLPVVSPQNPMLPRPNAAPAPTPDNRRRIRVINNANP